MTSIVTNTAAIAALQTLRSVGGELDQTQNHVSSGLRITQASDNAAYWSISTTMRSDSKTISAVSDALGLSAAMADTAYTATSAIVDIISDVKAKLVAASEPGVDKAKVQKEITQLAGQARSIADAASFNGQNWLVSGVPMHLAEAPALTDNLISSFSRSRTGSVSLDTIELDLKASSMFNSDGGGLLQKDPPPVFNELPPTVHDNFRPRGSQTHTLAGPATFGAGSNISFRLVVDRSPEEATGQVHDIAIDQAAVNAAIGSNTISTPDQWERVLEHVFANAGAPVDVYSTDPYNPSLPYLSHFPGSFTIATRETSGLVGSSIYLENVTTNLAGTNTMGLADTPYSNYDNLYESATTSFNGPFTLAGGIDLSFTFRMNADDPVSVTVTEARVNSTLGITTGQVNSADELAEVIRAAIDDTGMTDQGLEIRVSGSELTFTPNQDFYPGYGGKAAVFEMTDIVSSEGWSLRYDLDEIDLTTNTYSTDEYIRGVEHMLTLAIESAADLGSLKSRIDMQNDFAMELMDTFDAGIGKLVDADMDWESTRLKALQTQQQLAVQSLSIANSNSQGLLQLFN
ncbi:flagellin [Neorhizobium huautlense]|uniref:Flagellin n=1 Tax=Neorhizobium huautlense TaxID=67774 RepID=A0ABT9PMG1_9HYPH|nr:flagellin [Neorhizobium huautlense]MDP9835649.1 flagellin [Neorhizobium huautlense]